MHGRDLTRNPIAVPLVVLLAGIVLLCAGALSFIVFDVVKQDIATHEAEDPRACLTIEDNAARLSCLENRVGREPSPPARGANAPIKLFEH